jgi:hypothetical protein
MAEPMGQSKGFLTSWLAKGREREKELGSEVLFKSRPTVT